MRHITLIILLLAILLFFLSSNFYTLYYSNQHTYFPHGLKISGTSFLSIDWYSNTRPAHIVFTILVAALNRLGVLNQASIGIEFLLAFCLILALWLQTLSILSELKQQGMAWFRLVSVRLLAADILATLIIAYSFQDFLRGISFPLIPQFLDLRGVAGQYLFGGYLQPSEFGVLVILGMALMQIGNVRFAFALFGFAALMHFSYFIHTSVLALVGLLWLFRSGQRVLTIQSAAIYSLFAIPAVAYASSIAFHQPDAAEAAAILVFERIPHHALPQHWISFDAIIRYAIMLFSTVFLLKFSGGVVKWMYGVSTTYVVLGTIVVAISHSTSLALLFPWRASVYLVPIGTIVLLTYCMLFALNVVSRFSPQPWRVFQVVVFVGLILSLVFHCRSLCARGENDDREHTAVLNMVRQTTTEDNVLLIPPEWEWFRLAATRPIYVDWKSHPYASTEVLEWWKRINVAREFYKEDLISESRLNDICTTTDVSHVLISADQSRLSALPIASAEGFLLFRCPCPPAPFATPH